MSLKWPPNPITCRTEDFEDAIRWRMDFTIPHGLIFANADGSIKPGLLAKFEDGELVVLKGMTFKVAYLNEKSVTLEPLGIQTFGEASTDDE